MKKIISNIMDRINIWRLTRQAVRLKKKGYPNSHPVMVDGEMHPLWLFLPEKYL